VHLVRNSVPVVASGGIASHCSVFLDDFNPTNRSGSCDTNAGRSRFCSRHASKAWRVQRITEASTTNYVHDTLIRPEWNGCRTWSPVEVLTNRATFISMQVEPCGKSTREEPGTRKLPSSARNGTRSEVDGLQNRTRIRVRVQHSRTMENMWTQSLAQLVRNDRGAKDRWLGSRKRKH